MRMILDMDECICDMLTPLCQEYSRVIDKAFVIDDIVQYDLSIYPGMKELFLRPNFFVNLKPYREALKIIAQFHIEGKHEIFIATDPMGMDFIASEKLIWLHEHLPFLLPKNVFLGHRKDLLKGDLIFDDAPHHINGFDGIKVIMDKPYNQDVVADYRVQDWKEFYKLVRKLERM